MNLKTFNESLRKYYTEDIDDASKESFETDLRTALIDKAERLGRSGTMNLKRYEIEFQDTIETLVPEKSWWEVTDCDIFNNLFNTHDIMGTIDCIIDNLKPEYKTPYKTSEPSLKDSMNEGVIYDKPEVLGMGYAAPTSIDYADEVKVKLEHNAFEDLEYLQKYMNKTIEDVEEFDEYWNAHKSAIMKNIKEAQDLIPVEYRR